MKNIYDGILQFQGKWRTYQERVLENSRNYLLDGKLHIVAAPGSGKTTLGIELIRRLGAPCLILSPSITIRQQWLERITEGFLPENCRKYIEFVEKHIECPITMVSNGPGRDDIIYRK